MEGQESFSSAIVRGLRWTGNLKTFPYPSDRRKDGHLLSENFVCLFCFCYRTLFIFLYVSPLGFVLHWLRRPSQVPSEMCVPHTELNTKIRIYFQTTRLFSLYVRSVVLVAFVCGSPFSYSLLQPLFSTHESSRALRPRKEMYVLEVIPMGTRSA